jgi:hypothetical protein
MIQIGLTAADGSIAHYETDQSPVHEDTFNSELGTVRCVKDCKSANPPFAITPTNGLVTQSNGS